MVNEHRAIDGQSGKGRLIRFLCVRLRSRGRLSNLDALGGRLMAQAKKQEGGDSANRLHHGEMPLTQVPKLLPFPEERFRRGG